MKKIVFFLILCIFGSACQDSNDFIQDSDSMQFPTSINSGDWKKSYSPEEIVKLKSYVKAVDNQLVLMKNLSFAIDTLKICQEAYEDLAANIAEVNKVIVKAVRDSFDVNLQYPFPVTRSGSHTGYIFTKNCSVDNLKTPIILKSFEKSAYSKVLLNYMLPNSNCYFMSGSANIISHTYVNTSVFFWAFMIYDEVWGNEQGETGMGVLGSGFGHYEYYWTYALDNHTGEFNWLFRNVSSSTDGVSISHQFWGMKVLQN